MTSLLWVLVGHSLAEFVLDTDANRIRRQALKRTAPGAYAGHAVVVTAAVFMSLWALQGKNPLWAIVCTVCVAIAHVLIDIAQNTVIKKLPLESVLAKGLGHVDRGLYRVIVFLTAQVLHFFALIWITGLFFPPGYPVSQIAWYFRHHLLGAEPIPPGELPAYVTLAGILATFGAADLIKLAIRSFAPPANRKKVTLTDTFVTEESSQGSTGTSGSILAKTEAGLAKLSASSAVVQEPLSQEVRAGTGYLKLKRSQRTEEYEEQAEGTLGSGRWIGILERLLVVILVAIGNWSGIAFVFTAKSLARYKQLDNRDFAEYYIVGTLISILIGILFGLLVGKALGTLK